MPEQFVPKGTDLKDLEAGVPNKFKWSWLEEKDTNGDFLSSYVRKIVEPGMVYCKFCCQKVKYGGKGKSMIKRHADSTAHKKKRGAVTMNIHNARHLS